MYAGRIIEPFWQKAMLVLMLTGLWLNTLAPAGYMIAPSNSGFLSVVVCPETHPLGRTLTTGQSPSAVDHAVMGHHHHHADEGMEDLVSQTTECAFAGINKLATGALNLVLLSLALAFVMLLGLAPRPTLRLPKLTNLRPPLRGPPLSFA
ncbi:MAG: DUF2946 family protein [Pseudomonadota bacterium]